jgi:hypothetical protein
LSTLDNGGLAASSLFCSSYRRLRRYRCHESNKSFASFAVDCDTATKPDGNRWGRRGFRRSGYKFDATELPVAEEWDGYPRGNVVHVHHASNVGFRQ